MKLKVAIIGSGPAGASAGLYLKNIGHAPVVFERVKEPKPVGAGIMLQSTGLRCLQDFGLAEKAIERGTPIYSMHGDDHRGRKVVDFKFNNPDGLYGLGTHRSSLYFLLFNKLKEQSIEVILGTEIVQIEGKDKKTLTDTNGKEYDDFDLVVVCSGASAALRKGLSITKMDKKQSYGAIWSKIPYDNSILNNSIIQFYEGSYKMIGFMPIGQADDTKQQYINFFWSIKMSEVEKWKKRDLNEWLKEAKDLAPGYEDIIDKITSWEQLTVAPYRRAILNPFYQDRVVFIGDAAHPMSPQLSQGSSFAMIDAKILAESLQTYSQNIESALQNFARSRQPQISYYQKISRFATPLFQSDTKRPWLRKVLFKAICAFGFSRKILVDTVLGYRMGVFSNLKKEYYKA